jgi:hypothetical protein
MTHINHMFEMPLFLSEYAHMVVIDQLSDRTPLFLRLQPSVILFFTSFVYSILLKIRAGHKGSFGLEISRYHPPTDHLGPGGSADGK